ncbi:MAG: hypothetical protein AAGA81_21000 [Acidobacteriota bacterium]
MRVSLLRKFSLSTLIATAALASLSLPSFAGVSLGDGQTTGKVPVRSAGPLAFSPDGVLFLGDSLSGALFAVDSSADAGSPGAISLDGVDRKVAALLGTTPEGIRIVDLAVHPKSGRAYLSVARGSGPEAQAAVVTVDKAGTVDLFSLDEVAYSKLELPNPVSETAEDRRGRPLRMQAITDIAYAGGKVLVAGLSNEEFSSRMHTLDFPFTQAKSGVGIEVYHGAHGKWETHAPVRTLTTYDIGGAAHVLAAYTCTPLVTFPVTDLVDGAEVRGTTVAELGNRNRPLDMIVYSDGGQDYALMANSSRGVMKVDLSSIESQEGLTSRVADRAGLKYETIAELQDVTQLDRLDGDHSLLLIESDTGAKLQTVALP